MASAVCSTSCSLTLQPKAFQSFHPIGGVSASPLPSALAAGADASEMTGAAGRISAAASTSFQARASRGAALRELLCFIGYMGCHLWRSHDVGPPGGVPAEQVDTEFGRAIGVGRVVVVDEQVAAGVVHDALPARADDVAVTGENLGAATRRHRGTALVHVRAGGAGRPADHDAVRAVHAAAAVVEGDEQVVVAAVRIDVAGLLRVRRRPLRDAVAGGVPAGLLPGGRVDLDHLDAAPERPERQPPASAAVNAEARVDGVEVAGTLRGVDETLIVPTARRGGGTGGQADRGMVGPDADHREVQPVGAVVL